MSKNIIIVLLLIIGFSFDSWGQDTVDQNAVQTAYNKELEGLCKSGESAASCNKFQQLMASDDSFASRVGQIAAQAAKVTDPLTAPPCIEAASKITQALGEIRPSQATCNTGSAVAEKLCVLSSNPLVQQGTAMMSALTQSLANSASAKETCDQTNKYSFLTQGLMGVGAASCITAQKSCMSSCKINTDQLEGLKVAAGGCPQAMGQLAALVEAKSTAKKTQVAACAAYAPNIAQMMGIAAQMLQSSLQAKACSEQLAGNSNMTTAQLCAIAANANSTMCKCQADNKAPGCPGAIAQVAGGNLKALNTGGVSSLASLGSGNKVGSGDSGLDLSGLGEDAKRELEKLDESSSSMFGSAGGASAGGLGTSPAGTAPGAAGAAEEGSSIGSKFANAMGSLMRGAGFGGGFGGGAKPSNSKIQADQYNKIQRKLAAEQFGKEVSGASGLTNFEKINRRYTSNIPTFLSGE